VNEDVLLQEHMTGTEYVVDTVSFDGRHSVTDMLKYKRVRYGDGMAVYDSVEWIPFDKEKYSDLIEYGLGALDAIGTTQTRHLGEALRWALSPAGTSERRRAS